MKSNTTVRKMFSDSLRRSKSGNRALWTKDELLTGFNHFRELYGHFPTAHEIDAFEYLPSS